MRTDKPLKVEATVAGGSKEERVWVRIEVEIYLAALGFKRTYVGVDRSGREHFVMEEQHDKPSES